MLIYFSAENFRSIKDEVCLDMRTAPRLRRLAHHVVKPLEDNPKLAVLRSGVIYGANASGKSNLIKALKYVQDCVLSRDGSSKGIKSEPFKLVNSINPESKFYIEFASFGKLFGFGFSVDKERVVNEYLYLLNDDEETCIYERKFNIASESYEVTSVLEEEQDEEKPSQLSDFLLLIKYTSKDKLFISEAIDKNLNETMKSIGRLLLPTFLFFKSKLLIIFPNTTYGGIHKDINNEEDDCPNYVALLTRFDTGVSGISSERVDTNTLPSSVLKLVKERLQLKERYPMSYRGVKYNFELDSDNEIIATKIVTTRQIDDSTTITFDLEEESDGTCRLLDLLPALSHVSSHEYAGRTFIIDEFDRSLHPNLSRDFLSIFLNGKNSHSEDQLIVTTHESNLLDSELLRRDEIWFVQKEDDQSSSLYSLNDYSPRFDKDLRKAYLNGTYGGVPFIMSEYEKS